MIHFLFFFLFAFFVHLHDLLNGEGSKVSAFSMTICMSDKMSSDTDVNDMDHLQRAVSLWKQILLRTLCLFSGDFGAEAYWPKAAAGGRD